MSSRSTRRSTAANEEAYAIRGGVDPSKATEQELLACLRTKYRRYKVEKRARKLESMEVNPGLAGKDPYFLPDLFVTSLHKRAPQQQTLSGCWKEKHGEFTAIRSGREGERYAGMRMTMEFFRRDGTKTDWRMQQYYLLDTHNLSDLYFEEEMMLCKIFQEDDVDEYQDPCSKEMLKRNTTSFNDCLATEGFPTDRTQPGKRPRSCAPGGKSEVWQNFTKIHTKDPDVVYAACHCCDRVLNAHPKNGTSHLRRHMQKCSSHNPSTAADQEILHRLRSNLNLYKQEKMIGKLDSPEVNASLAKLDPWDPQLTPCYFTSSLSRETHQGRWEEIDKELTAIRIDQLPVPRYLGLRRTLEFHNHNGNKMDWIMLEYHQVDEYKHPNLLLQGGLVFRKVFQSYKDAVSYTLRELDRMWNGDDQEHDCYNGEREEEVKTCMNTLLRDCLLGKGVQGDETRPGTRKRTNSSDGRSEVWLQFSKIYTSDPDRVYAVCHCCDRGYNGHSRNGTSHLRRHNEKCSRKQHELPWQNGAGNTNGVDAVWEATVWAFPLRREL